MRIHRHRQRKSQIVIPQYKVNDKIRSDEVRVIFGETNDVMTREAAIALAEEQGLDLIEVSPKANPPVCKLMDFGSFKYQKEKEAKKQKAAQKEIEIKGIRLTVRIGEGDLEIRRKQALKFLEKGSKVRIEMILRGREKAYRDRAQEIIDGFIAKVKEVRPVKVESPLKNVGNRIHTIIANEG